MCIRCFGFTSLQRKALHVCIQISINAGPGVHLGCQPADLDSWVRDRCFIWDEHSGPSIGQGEKGSDAALQPARTCPVQGLSVHPTCVWYGISMSLKSMVIVVCFSAAAAIMVLLIDIIVGIEVR